MKQAKQFPFLTIQKQRFAFAFANQSSERNIPSERQFYQWIWHALKNEYRRAEISLLLLDEADARAYNRDYRQKGYATNVLSFALNEGEMMLHESDHPARRFNHLSASGAPRSHRAGQAAGASLRAFGDTRHLAPDGLRPHQR